MSLRRADTSLLLLDIWLWFIIRPSLVSILLLTSSLVDSAPGTELRFESAVSF